MLDPRLNPQEQPFLFHESNKNHNTTIGRPTSHDRYEYESSWDSMNYAFRAQKTAQNYANNYKGVRSPRPSPPGSPRRNNYRSMSPASRAQAIARGQKELMEMVSNMPESCYELSLKDLVEHNRQRDARDDNRNDVSSQSGLLERRDSERRSSFGQDDVVGFRASRPKAAVTRMAGSMETNGSGHLLKMGFPVSFGSKNRRAKKKTAMKVTKKNSTESYDTNSNININTNTTCPKVSPNNNNNNNNSVVDKEWWKKRYSVGGESGVGGGESDQSGGDQSSCADGSRKSTATTSSSGSRSSSLSSQNSTSHTIPRRGSGGCWWFIGKKKSRDVE